MVIKMLAIAHELNKETFLEKYGLQVYYEQSGLQWENLQQIYNDYINKRNDITKQCVAFEEKCRKEFDTDKVKYHSIHSRIKDPEHLIEKIIRKCGKEHSKKYRGINVHNYLSILQDLIGLRILVIQKEDWEVIFDKLTQMFPTDDTNVNYMATEPIAYIRYGDRDIYKKKIYSDYSNKDYRSQHYIINFGGWFCEIQVRTITEEVYGEFDHLVKYPYREDNNFLKRYTNMVSKFTNTIDEMISTCIQMNEDGWNANAAYFESDLYIEWRATTQRITKETQVVEIGETKSQDTQTTINMQKRANDILFRRGER